MIGLAQKQATKSEAPFKHGAVVAKGSRVLGLGHNTYKGHPTWGTFLKHNVTGEQLCSTHAEAVAIRDAVSRGCNLKGASIYVARHNGRISRPCASCREKIRQHGIRKVYYTDGDGKVVCEWPLHVLRT